MQQWGLRIETGSNAILTKIVKNTVGEVVEVEEMREMGEIVDDEDGIFVAVHPLDAYLGKKRKDMHICPCYK